MRSTGTMTLFGLHFLDWLVILFYFLLMIVIGVWARRRISNTRDFYQGGRSFGKVLSVFLSFGSMTSSDQAAGVTREIYRQGLSGLWFQNLTLFLTPFYWFTSILQKRVRYIGPGDMYLHRFESKNLGMLFATYTLLVAIYGGAFALVITGKTLQAMMVKPPSEHTAAQTQSVHDFNRYQEILQKQTHTALDEKEKAELVLLREKDKRDELQSFVSYLDINWFYVSYALIVGAYTILGGLFAVAFTDVIQGILILFLSFSMIPLGLMKLGGFTGLHAHVPDYMFELFGSSQVSEYTWYFVAVFAAANLVGLPPKNFTSGGAPRDDMTARVGVIVGSFAKRFVTIGWALTGLIAVGLFGGLLSDPTMIWGHMTRELLGPGFVGLMIAAIMAGNMSTKGAVCLEFSAAFTQNILLPLRPKTGQRAQITIGRLVIIIVLFSSIFVAQRLDDVFVLFKNIISIGTIIGPALWLVYMWRRLTTKAVVVQMVLSILTTAVIPSVAPMFEAVRASPALTVQTPEKVYVISTKAVAEDVTLGLADSVGQVIEKRRVQPPLAIYFDEVVREDEHDSASRLVGKGSFKNQIYYCSLLGVPVESMNKAQLSTASLLFDIIFPFLVLFAVSLVTKRNSEKTLREFYAAMHTPTVADPVEDARLVQEAIDHPEIVEKRKLFPHTDWEFWKPTKADTWGFIGSWVMVGIIIGLYLFLMSIGG
jgi:SSS family solute:Na+ symporter